MRTTGPYAVVRHPSYTGLLLTAARTVDSGNRAAVSPMVGLWALPTVQSRWEEQHLRRRFPDYPAYAGHTPRLLPHPTAGPASAARRRGAR